MGRRGEAEVPAEEAEVGREARRPLEGVEVVVPALLQRTTVQTLSRFCCENLVSFVKECIRV